jgi:hypothetical protein
MNHYCTFFDRGYLVQGLALWRSLAAHDPDAVLWVLALDDLTAKVMRDSGGTWLRVVPLTELEGGDVELSAAKSNRSLVDYYFTLQSCWPRWLLAKQPDLDRVTAIDADLMFFSSPAAVFNAMDTARASVLVTAHRFPDWLRHYEQHGKFNAGFVVFRRDAAGLACLDDWRARCLAWCHDRVEGGKYASQRYLDDWPARFGPALLALPHPGVNLAPWNWAASPWTVDQEGRVLVDCQPLVVFHFARFRPILGRRWWQSGQLDYGVMPHRLRTAIYGPYWQALEAARRELTGRTSESDVPRRSARLGPGFWRDLPLRILFGSDWLRVGDSFYSGRLGLGQFSGRFLALLRRVSGRGRPGARS